MHWSGSQQGLRIAGAATAFPSALCGPSCELDNEATYRALLGPDAPAELAARGWTPRHPEARWGVRRRQWSRMPGAGPLCTAHDLAVLAARSAVDRARIAASDVALVVVASSTPPHVTSSMAGALARALHLDAMAFDLRAGGAGGLEAWVTASRLLGSGARTALVVAASTPSHYLDPTDLSAALLYGDGAAALVLQHAPEHPGGLRVAVAGNVTPAGVSFTVPGRLPPAPGERYRFRTPDRTYGRSLADTWSMASERLARGLEHLGRVDHFAPYAVTRTQVEAASAALDASPEEGLAVLRDHGCIGSAGPLVTVARLVERGALRPGDNLAALAVGGGVGWCGLVWGA